MYSMLRRPRETMSGIPVVLSDIPESKHVAAGEWSALRGGLRSVIERTLSFSWHAGGVTSIRIAHSTGYRVMPYLMTSHIVDGAFEVVTTRQRKFRSSPGDVLTAPPHVKHCTTLVSQGLAVSRWSHTTFTIFHAVDIFSIVAVPPVIPAGKAAVTIGDANSQLAELAHEPPTLLAMAKRQRCGYMLLEALLSVATTPPDAIARLGAVERIAPALALARGRLAEALDLSTLAKTCGLSVSRFCALFKAAVNCSPLAWVRHARLEHAQQLLLSSDDPVYLVARQAGFSDAFHFSRLFKRRFGVSPQRYRLQLRASPI